MMIWSGLIGNYKRDNGNGYSVTKRQERTAPVFVFATANNAGNLDPALLRKGRFAEIWGVQEPNEEERAAIWNIHIKKVRPYLKVEDHFDIPRLVSISDKYTGAEIEAIVEEAMFLAYNEKGREFDTDDLVKCAADVVPQSTMMKDSIDLIRSWIRERTRNVTVAHTPTQKTGDQDNMLQVLRVSAEDHETNPELN